MINGFVSGNPREPSGAPGVRSGVVMEKVRLKEKQMVRLKEKQMGIRRTFRRLAHHFRW